jgi:hypothetical protein
VDLSDRLILGGYIACAAISLGTLGPWAVAGPVTHSGVDDQFGLYTLLLGAFGGFVLWRWAQFPKQEFLIGLAIVGGICLVTSGYFAFQPDGLLDLPAVSAGWGLVVTLAGSCGVLAVAGLLYRDSTT